MCTCCKHARVGTRSWRIKGIVEAGAERLYAAVSLSQAIPERLSWAADGGSEQVAAS